MPTSEFVTRCKDCYHCEGIVGKEYCDKSGCYVDPNFFCADGCREDNEFVTNFDIINSVEGKCRIHWVPADCEHWEELKNAEN